jgi:RNA polymerase sigma-70 factor (family 1)
MAKIQNEDILIKEINRDSTEAFSMIFCTYYQDLVLFAGTYIKDLAECEDIVQLIFQNLWSNRSELTIESSLKSYLLKAVRNECLDNLKHKQIVNEYISHQLSISTVAINDTENYILYSELNEKLQDALYSLPPMDREIFNMSRFKNMKYKEIADKYNISIRTVEVHIAKVLKFLNSTLKDFYLVIILLYLILLCEF